MDYLDLVEEHDGKSEINLFEKVKIMANRARDLYSGKTSIIKDKKQGEGRKPIALAQYEVLKGLIEPDIADVKDKSGDAYDDLSAE